MARKQKDAEDDGWGGTVEGDEMNFDMDSTGVSGEDLGSGEGQVEKEGWYHWEIGDVSPELDKVKDNGKFTTPNIRFDMIVLETVEGQSPANSRLFHRMYLCKVDKDSGDVSEISEGSKKNALRFGIGLGLLAEKEDGTIVVAETLKDAKTGAVIAEAGSTKIPTKLWLFAKGRQCVSKVALEASENPAYKAAYKIPFSRVYPVDHPSVADVPKNAEMLELIGKGDLVKKPAAKGAKAPAKKAAPGKPAAAAQSAAVDDLADL